MPNPLENFIGGILGGNIECQNLFEAVQTNNQGAAEQLIRRGADVEQVDEEDGWTPLQAACWLDRPNVLTVLVKDASSDGLDYQDVSGRTGVHLAAIRGHERCLRVMLHAGADPNITDQHGLTALHKAAAAGRLHCLRTLLFHRTDVKKPTPDGLSALHLAAWKAHVDAVRLLSRYYDDCSPTANDGSTPLHEAVRSGDLNTVNMLIDLGADVMARDQNGRSPIDLAFAAGKRNLFSALQDARSKRTHGQRNPYPTHGEPEPKHDYDSVDDFWKKISGLEAPSAPKQPPPEVKKQAQNKGGAQKPADGRKGFENWMASVIFPQIGNVLDTLPQKDEGQMQKQQQQRQQKQQQQQSQVKYDAFGRPYNTGEKQQGQDYGSMGGDVFAQRRAKDEQKKQEQQQQQQTSQAAAKPSMNLQYDLEPYSTPQSARNQAPPLVAHDKPQKSPASAPWVDEQVPDIMKAIQNKAMSDIKLVLSAGARFANAMSQQNNAGRPQQQAGKSQWPGKAEPSKQPPAAAGKADDGDPDAYDSDDYDEASFKEARTKANEDDGWGRPKPTKASEEKIYSKEEAQKRLYEMDKMTTKAQGWMRGPDAQRRLAAMQLLFPDDADDYKPNARTRAQDPYAPLRSNRIESRDESLRMAAEAHITDSVSAAGWAASRDSGNLAIPSVDFGDLWRATDGFSESHLMYEDVFSKVFHADVLGEPHAVRVLNPESVTPSALSSWLKAISKLRHPHLNELRGTCVDRCILVYALPACGNALFAIMHGVAPSGERLSWRHGIEIALAVASAVLTTHSAQTPLAVGGLCASSVLLDRHGRAFVDGAGLTGLLGQSKDQRAAQIGDVQALGKLMLQLLTLNTEHIDDDRAQAIVNYIDAGQHLTPSSALQWPSHLSQAYETVAVDCLKADSHRSLQKFLTDSVLPSLLSLRQQMTDSLSDNPPPASEVEPSYMLCPLTKDVMLDPVHAADGFAYERSAIEKWLSMGRRPSPMTWQSLSHPFLTADDGLRRAIKTWVTQHLRTA